MNKKVLQWVQWWSSSATTVVLVVVVGMMIVHLLFVCDYLLAVYLLSSPDLSRCIIPYITGSRLFFAVVETPSLQKVFQPNHQSLATTC